jgi:hypothetical protein
MPQLRQVQPLHPLHLHLPTDLYEGSPAEEDTESSSSTPEENFTSESTEAPETVSEEDEAEARSAAAVQEALETLGVEENQEGFNNSYEGVLTMAGANAGVYYGGGDDEPTTDVEPGTVDRGSGGSGGSGGSDGGTGGFVQNAVDFANEVSDWRQTQRDAEAKRVADEEAAQEAIDTIFGDF